MQSVHETGLLLAEVPVALARYLGGSNLQPHETSYLTTHLSPPPWFTSSLAMAQSPGDIVGMWPPAANSAAFASSASWCFHAKFPAKLAVPYHWASSP